MRFLSAFWRDKRGASAAEMALILPFLVVMIFGAIEMGYYFYNEHQVIKGVRDGARYASRQSFTAINCVSGYTLPTATRDAIREVTRTGRPSGGTARVYGWVNADVTVTVTCGSTAYKYGIYRDEPQPPIVTVTAQVDYNALFDGLGVLTDTYKLNATQQAAVMGI